MKPLFSVILLVITAIQPLKAQVWEFINEVPGKSKDQIYDASREWIALIFNSAKDVIQSEDKETGKIIFKARSIYREEIIDFAVDYTGMIECKDGRYRCRYFDISIINTYFNLPASYDEFTYIKSDSMLVQRYLKAGKSVPSGKRFEKESSAYKARIDFFNNLFSDQCNKLKDYILNYNDEW